MDHLKDNKTLDELACASRPHINWFLSWVLAPTFLPA